MYKRCIHLPTVNMTLTNICSGSMVTSTTELTLRFLPPQFETRLSDTFCPAMVCSSSFRGSSFVFLFINRPPYSFIGSCLSTAYLTFLDFIQGVY